MEQPSILDYHFVCLIDILGFSYMVRSDCEGPRGSERYLKKLLLNHKKASKLSISSLEINLIQFSDTIIIATPFNSESFLDFIEIISKYQYDLYIEGILCRGGVAYGKHFYENGFLFSNGLIEAYNIERKISKYPRIVVSENLINLIFPHNEGLSIYPLMKENDGAVFVDYFKNGNSGEISKALDYIFSTSGEIEPSVKGKHRWMLEYFNFKFPSKTGLGEPRFINLS